MTPARGNMDTARAQHNWVFSRIPGEWHELPIDTKAARNPALDKTSQTRYPDDGFTQAR